MTLKMSKMTQNLQRKLKITDFLLGLDFAKRLFGRYWGFTCVPIFIHVRET